MHKAVSGFLLHFALYTYACLVTIHWKWDEEICNPFGWQISASEPRRAEINDTQNAPAMGSSSQTLLAWFEERELHSRFSLWACNQICSQSRGRPSEHFPFLGHAWFILPAPIVISGANLSASFLCSFLFINFWLIIPFA